MASESAFESAKKRQRVEVRNGDSLLVCRYSFDPVRECRSGEASVNSPFPRLPDSPNGSAVYQDARAVCAIQIKRCETNVKSLVLAGISIDITMALPF